MTTHDLRKLSRTTAISFLLRFSSVEQGRPSSSAKRLVLEIFSFRSFGAFWKNGLKLVAQGSLAAEKRSVLELEQSVLYVECAPEPMEAGHIQCCVGARQTWRSLQKDKLAKEQGDEAL